MQYISMLVSVYCRALKGGMPPEAADFEVSCVSICTCVLVKQVNWPPAMPRVRPTLSVPALSALSCANSRFDDTPFAPLTRQVLVSETKKLALARRWRGAQAQAQIAAGSIRRHPAAVMHQTESAESARVRLLDSQMSERVPPLG